MADDYFNDSNIPEIDIQIKSEKIVSSGKKIKFHILKAGQVYRRINHRPYETQESCSMIIVLELNPNNERDFWWVARGSCIFDNGMVTTLSDPLPMLSEDIWELVEELEDFNGK